jgi:hypothetical protein
MNSDKNLDIMSNLKEISEELLQTRIAILRNEPKDKLDDRLYNLELMVFKVMDKL